MSFLKKPAGAMLVALAIIILSSFFAANRSLNVKVQEVSDLFSTDFYDKNVGYKQKSIKSQLEIRKEASNILVGVGANYSGAEAETEALRKARDIMSNGLSRSFGPEKLYDVNADLQKAYDTLYEKIVQLPLNTKERKDLDESKSNMTGAASVIERSGYNEAVREFNRKVLSAFPTNYIKSIALVKSPELFE